MDAGQTRLAACEASGVIDGLYSEWGFRTVLKAQIQENYFGATSTISTA
jgi:hypothetical protein